MRISESIWLLALLVLCASITSGCGSKARHRKPAVPTASVDVARLAGKAFDHVKARTPLDEDRRTNAFAVCVAEELIHDMHGDWQIAIFRKNSPSAFVLPGRKMGVSGGLVRLARNQHQLAAVIAHGLAHMLARHPDNRVARQVAAHPEVDLMKAAERPASSEARLVDQLLGIEPEGGGFDALPFDRGDEAEANALGLELMARAGFNPRESLAVWRNLDGGARSSTRGFATLHPSYGNRSAAFDKHMEAALKLQPQSPGGRKRPQCDRLR